jgi:serine/threonine protein kinase
MKTLPKRSELEDCWLRYVKTERDILAYSDNPFIIKLHFAFQTKKKLFLVIDFCPGGDLETLLSQSKYPFSEQKARIYIAEIIVALRDLHSRDIIYRDLKPDNVVIDDEGHVKLIDFGMAKQDVAQSMSGAKTFCGSVKYLAPEMLKKVGHGQALDWYLLGVLLYEMIIGVTPYYSNDKDELFKNIISGKLKMPRSISSEVKSLIIQLLNRNPSKRLGSLPGADGAEQIMAHPFFKGVDWNRI